MCRIGHAYLLEGTDGTLGDDPSTALAQQGLSVIWKLISDTSFPSPALPERTIFLRPPFFPLSFLPPTLCSTAYHGDLRTLKGHREFSQRKSICDFWSRWLSSFLLVGTMLCYLEALGPCCCFLASALSKRPHVLGDFVRWASRSEGHTFLPEAGQWV